jgi:hypothetical protein
MAQKKCPPGFICTDTTTIWFFILIAGAIVVGLYFVRPIPESVSPKIFVVNTPVPEVQQHIRPDLYPEPIMRTGFAPPSIASRGPVGPVQQVGILTAEGGSSSSAAPDRTILPLYGRELDSRRSRWNYYTRTDGSNPVQVPVRVGNRVCDDDTNGCNEVYNDDAVHVPVLGRSFKATIYRKSLF